MMVVAGARLTILGLSLAVLAGGMSIATPSDLPFQQGRWPFDRFMGEYILCFSINMHHATGLALSTPFQHL